MAHRRTHAPTLSNQNGFTLVELLVVIGIIAVLIGILLPSLAGARRMAQRTACAVRLHQIALAAQVQAANHQGYYPLVGMIGNIDPVDLDDPGRVRYEYYMDGILHTPLLAPITLALGRQMQGGPLLQNTDTLKLGILLKDPGGFIRNFVCPSQELNFNDPSGMTTLLSGMSPTSPVYAVETQSYIYNEAVLGFDDKYGRLRGKSTRVKHPSKTMFAADGLGGYNGDGWRPSTWSFYPAFDSEFAYSTVYNNSISLVSTLGDVLSGRKISGYVVAGDVQSFDRVRHRGKINVVFCDGHVETRDITVNDLQSVVLLEP